MTAKISAPNQPVFHPETNLAAKQGTSSTKIGRLFHQVLESLSQSFSTMRAKMRSFRWNSGQSTASTSKISAFFQKLFGKNSSSTKTRNRDLNVIKPLKEKTFDANGNLLVRGRMVLGKPLTRGSLPDFETYSLEKTSLTSLEDLDREAKIIEEKIANKKNIFIHSGNNEESSELAVIAYLMRTHYLTPDEAVEYLEVSRNKTISHKEKNLKLVNSYRDYLNKTHTKITTTSSSFCQDHIDYFLNDDQTDLKEKINENMTQYFKKDFNRSTFSIKSNGEEIVFDPKDGTSKFIEHLKKELDTNDYTVINKILAYTQQTTILFMSTMKKFKDRTNKMVNSNLGRVGNTDSNNYIISIEDEQVVIEGKNTADLSRQSADGVIGQQIARYKVTLSKKDGTAIKDAILEDQLIMNLAKVEKKQIPKNSKKPALPKVPILRTPESTRNAFDPLFAHMIV